MNFFSFKCLMAFFLLIMSFVPVLSHADEVKEERDEASYLSLSHPAVTDSRIFQEELKNLRDKFSSKVLTIHLVPHSHDDVGWLMTPDQYYERQVRYIYDNVFACLKANKKRKFIVVEQAFFSRWYKALDLESKTEVKSLLKNKQMEFISGGWVMHDEACTTEFGIIHQMSLGHKFIKQEFNETVRFGYQIDPFGHSAMNARLLADFGMEAMVTNRIHHQDKSKRKSLKSMEFYWKPDLYKPMIFNHILDAHYNSPDGFDFEKDPPIANQRDLEHRARALVLHLLVRAQNYRSNSNFLLLIGDDFRFQNAQIQYGDWELLIDYINANIDAFGIKLKYSLLSEYFDSIKKENLEFPEYTGDFFPYADYESSYWSGYYTSKSNLKSIARKAETWLKLLNIKELQARLIDSSIKATRARQTLEKSLAEIQHHDGITGTAKEFVSKYYQRELEKGIQNAQEFIKRLYSPNIVNSVIDDKFQNFYQEHAQVNSLEVGETANVLVFNPLSSSSRSIVRIPCPFSSVKITDEKSHVMKFQVIEALDSKKRQKFELLLDLEIEAFSERFLSIERLAQTSSQINTWKSLPLNEPVLIENDEIGLTMSHQTLRGRRNKDVFSLEFEKKSSGYKQKIDPWIWQYRSYNGSDQPAGAYIFRVEKPHAVPLKPVRASYQQGLFVDQFKLEYSDSKYQVFRLYKQDSSLNSRTEFRSSSVLNGAQTSNVEVISVLGDLEKDQELVMRFGQFLEEYDYSFYSVDDDEQSASKHRSVSFPSRKFKPCELHSDANGSKLTKRRTINMHPRIESNFYPMTAFAALECSSPETVKKAEKSLLMAWTDRSVAVGQVDWGIMEFLVHRRTSKDDNRGVGEPLDDKSTVSVQINLGLEVEKRSSNKDQDSSISQFLLKTSHQLRMAPVSLFIGKNASPGETDFDKTNPVTEDLAANSQNIGRPTVNKVSGQFSFLGKPFSNLEKLGWFVISVESWSFDLPSGAGKDAGPTEPIRNSTDRILVRLQCFNDLCSSPENINAFMDFEVNQKQSRTKSGGDKRKSTGRYKLLHNKPMWLNGNERKLELQPNRRNLERQHVLQLAINEARLGDIETLVFSADAQ